MTCCPEMERLIDRDLARFVTMIQSGDMRPAKSGTESAAVSCHALRDDLARWRKFNVETLPTFNRLLKEFKLTALMAVSVGKDPACLN